MIIPREVFKHYHYREAVTAATVLHKSRDPLSGGVVGTSNSGRCELYGWSNPVRPHVDTADKSSRIHFCLLSGTAEVITHGPRGGEYVHKAVPGKIITMHDAFRHWTNGEGICVALFVAGHSRPEAEVILERGLARLASGNRNAPRVRDGFRHMQKGECYATHSWTDYTMMPIAVARRAKNHIIRCSQCRKPAAHMDDKWPYFSEYCFCHKHFLESRDDSKN